MSDLIADAIREHWGERCPDFDPECWCCRAWAEYDEITALRAEVEQWKQGHAAACGLAGRP